MEQGIINVHGVKHVVFLDPYASSNIISKSKFAKDCNKIGFSLSNPSQYGKSSALDCVHEGERGLLQNALHTF
jgi:hypothetical protein